MQQPADLLAQIVQGTHSPAAGSEGSRNAVDTVFTQVLLQSWYAVLDRTSSILSGVFASAAEDRRGTHVECLGRRLIGT